MPATKKTVETAKLDLLAGTAFNRFGTSDPVNPYEFKGSLGYWITGGFVYDIDEPES